MRRRSTRIRRVMNLAAGDDSWLTGFTICKSASTTRGDISRSCVHANIAALKTEYHVMCCSKGYMAIHPKGHVLASKVWPRRKDCKHKYVPKRLNQLIAEAVWGKPPSKYKMTSTHICGDTSCILASHIRWQDEDANALDRVHHKRYNVVPTVRTRTSRLHRVSRLSWRVKEGWKVPTE